MGPLDKFVRSGWINRIYIGFEKNDIISIDCLSGADILDESGNSFLHLFVSRTYVGYFSYLF